MHSTPFSPLSNPPHLVSVIALAAPARLLSGISRLRSTTVSVLAPSLLITSLFPHLRSAWPLASAAIFDFTSYSSLSHHTRRLHSISIISLTKHEVKIKTAGIQLEQRRIAGIIGTLTLASVRHGGLLPSAAACLDESVKVEEAKEIEEDAGKIIDELKIKIWSTIGTVDNVLSPSPTTIISGIPPRPVDLAMALSHLFESTLPRYINSTSNTLSHFQRPSLLIRSWPYLVFVPLASAWALQRIYNSRQTIVNLALNARATMSAFLIDWVAEPLLKIVETIRHKEGGTMTIMSRESLKSDLESLERMVIEFSRDQSSALSDEQLIELGHRVKEGDLTTVLTAFEKDIKNPLRSVIAGSLIRTLLIQVQKVKVDLALAMDGIEKMLSSQQLTFAFVGVAPSIIILYGVGRWIKGLCTSDGRSRRTKSEHRRTTFTTLRHLDSLISTPLASVTRNEIQGYLIIELSSLRSYAHSHAFPSRDTSAREAFLQDVRALEESSSLSPSSGVQEAENEERRRRVLLERLWRWRNEGKI